MPTPSDPVPIVVGEQWPGPLPPREGTILELFRSTGHLLLIAFDHPSKLEMRGLRRGIVTVGMLWEQTAMLFVWAVLDTKRRPVFTFETPFDARNIDASDLDIPDSVSADERLLLPIYMLDRVTSLVSVIRAATMPPMLSRLAVSRAREQLRHPDLKRSADATINRWLSLPTSELMRQTNMTRMGV